VHEEIQLEMIIKEFASPVCIISWCILRQWTSKIFITNPTPERLVSRVHI